jgi:hypothetical protein
MQLTLPPMRLRHLLRVFLVIKQWRQTNKKNTHGLLCERESSIRSQKAIMVHANVTKIENETHDTWVSIHGLHGLPGGGAVVSVVVPSHCVKLVII